MVELGTERGDQVHRDRMPAEGDAVSDDAMATSRGPGRSAGIEPAGPIS